MFCNPPYGGYDYPGQVSLDAGRVKGRGMWSTFRALAQRIGLSAEQVNAVERSGATEVQHPLAEDVHFMVRPDPDWSQRLVDAWTGELADSRREEAGTIVLARGLLAVDDADRPRDVLAIPVIPGAYRLALTIAHRGTKEAFDYDEGVSHAFLTLDGDHEVATIEPWLDDNGTRLEVNAYTFAFAVAGVLPQLAGDHWGLWAQRLNETRAAQDGGNGSKRYSCVFPNDDGSVAAIVWPAGEGRADYPLFRLVDAHERTVGVAADFYLDNRPWD
jgi:hypothetical protein